jgi:UDPglucose 6-dehydrogenase
VKIIIAGYGPVGIAIQESLFGRKMQVIIDDPWKGKGYVTTPADMEDVDGVVVCVATPQNPDGSCCTQNVKDVLRKYGRTKFLIKSAVDPVWLSQHHDEFGGSVTVSPEFLGSSNAYRNPTDEFINQEFAIFGGPDARWWDELFRPSLPKLKTVKYCTRDQAAFGKYLENCFLATRVTFFNEMFDVYDRCGFEGFDQMIDAITIDPRIGRSHSQVPGPDGRRGWGGHCLPKDTSAFEYFGIHTPLISAVREINEDHRSEE